MAAITSHSGRDKAITPRADKSAEGTKPVRAWVTLEITDHQPSANAEPLLDPHRQGRVRTAGPSGVMAMVCSVWAAQSPDAVTTLQSSSSTSVPG